MPIHTFTTQNLVKQFSRFSDLVKGKSSKYDYLEDEFRSPIKERHDMELEFILDVFGKKYFDPARYLSSEYTRVKGIKNTQRIVDKLNKCVVKTSVSLKELVQDNYVDFIHCFSQIHDIEQFFTKDGCNMFIDKILQQFATILRYQDELTYDLKYETWTDSLKKQNEKEKNIYDVNRVRVIPGNDIVDSPSSLLDDIYWMCDEKRWNEAISILNMMCHHIYQGEYNYLHPKTRKQIKKKLIQYRKVIFHEVTNLLMMNACNKLYRRRFTVYILRIQRSRYFNKGIKLYLECQLKELNHNIFNIELRGDLKTYVTDLTLLVFHSIRELIREFNEILIESGNLHQKDAMSSLIVFILRNMLSQYVDHFRNHVFEATKCDISLKLIGECLRIAFGHLNKLKWSGLCLEMYLNHYLFDMICDTVNLYFEDEINDTLHSLSNDTFEIKHISLLATASSSVKRLYNAQMQRRQSNSDRRRLSCIRYESVTVDIPAIEDGNDNGQNKTIIYITTSGQMVYKYIRKCLTESRSLLSFSYYPIMTQQLLSLFIENIIKYLQSYCSNITEILRKVKESSSLQKEAQCIGMIANVYYIANDLLYRTNDRLLKQCRFKKMERIDIFQNKLTILYKEQFKYFARIISMEWLYSILQFDAVEEGAIPLYYCGLSAFHNDDNGIIKPSNAWIALIERISMTHDLCSKYLHEKNAMNITQHIINVLVKYLKNDRYWMNDDRSSISSNTHTRHITHYGLQQFIFDIKFFAFITNNYLDDESKKLLHNTIINNAITLYCDTNNSTQLLTPGVVMKSNEHYQKMIHVFVSKSSHLCILELESTNQK